MLPDRDEGAFRGRPAMAEAVTTAAEVPPVASPLVRNTAPPQESMAAPSARVISLLVLAVLGPSVTLKSPPILEAVNSPLRSASVYPRSGRCASAPLAKTGGALVSLVACCRPTGDGTGSNVPEPTVRPTSPQDPVVATPLPGTVVSPVGAMTPFASFVPTFGDRTVMDPQVLPVLVTLVVLVASPSPDPAGPPAMVMGLPLVAPPP